MASNFGFSSGAPSQQAGTGAAPPNYRYIKVVLPFVLEYMINFKISITNIVMKLFTLFVLVVSQISQQVQLLHHTTVRFPATTLLFWMIIPTLQRFVKHKIEIVILKKSLEKIAHIYFEIFFSF